MIFVGNDIVDLENPRCQGKAGDSRFMSRIFDPSEVDLVQGALDRDRMVWVLWAAKEAAFKVVTKVLGSPPAFTHAHFIAEFDSSGGDGKGRVRFGGMKVTFASQPSKRCVHVVAWASAADVALSGPQSPVPEPAGLVAKMERVPEVLPGARAGDLEALRQSRFTDRERPAIYSLASAAVRVAARRGAAELLAVRAEEIEIVCEGPLGRSPPRLWLRGEPAHADVSLSHDGDWVAWATLRWTAEE